MKLKIISDIHLDYNPIFNCPNDFLNYEIAPGDYDVLVIAGDICEFDTTAKWASKIRKAIPAHKPIIVVPGNHDLWGATVDTTGTFSDPFGAFKLWEKEIWNEGLIPGFNRVLKMSGKTFFLTPLWYKTDHKSPPGWIDHSQIHGLTPSGSNMLAKLCEDFLIKSLLEHGQPDCVITHHFSKEESVHSRFKGDPYNCFFKHELPESLNDLEPKIWIHGHTHSNFDYVIKNTRFICNPRGYIMRNGQQENRYDNDLIVEI